MVAFAQDFARAYFEAWVSAETLPEWAVMGTSGTSLLIYASVLTVLGIGLTLALAVGTGYYIGQRMDALAEYRELFGAMLAGSAVGSIGTYKVILHIVRCVHPPFAPCPATS